MVISLILDGKRVKAEKLHDDTCIDKVMEIARKMVRKYDRYPFLQEKSTKQENGKLIIDLHTFNHQSSILEIEI